MGIVSSAKNDCFIVCLVPIKFQSPMGIVSSAKLFKCAQDSSGWKFQSPMGIVSSAKGDIPPYGSGF